MGRFLGAGGRENPLDDADIYLARRAFAKKSVAAGRKTFFFEHSRIAAGSVDRLHPGRGGGKKELAQGGGTKPQGLPEAFEALRAKLG